MIDWLFKKKAPPKPDTSRPDRAASIHARGAPSPATPAVVNLQAALAQAAGDDEALLALARGAAPLEVKLAAVAALASEAALKRAERELRKHDRRVHRLAKQRHAALLAQREARLQATQLTASARALLDEPLVAANRLVDLDRAWQALDPSLLADTTAADFGVLFTRLTALVRERADRALDLERWDATAREAVAGLKSTCEQAAEGAIDRAALAASAAKAQSALDAAIGDAERVARRCGALRDALHTAAELSTRLEVLDALLQAAAPMPSPLPGAKSAAAGGAEAASPDRGARARSAPSQETADPLLRWRALAPLADPSLARALDARIARWRAAHHQAKPARSTERPGAAVDPDAGARLETLAGSVEQAEAALAEGHLAEAGKQLSTIDTMLHDGAPPASLRARIDRLHAEAAQLRAWQQWGGARARDELVAQAEALAAADVNAAVAAVAKLTPRQRSALIGEMRARWRELDRHGGASNRALWQRFDTALEAAYAPVAAQAEAQRAARQQNLQARVALLNTLEAVALPGADALESAPGVATEVGSQVTSEESFETAPAARSPFAMPAIALADFQSAWRKLGPLEHTVPRAEREGLEARMRDAVARLEGPLSEARRSAQAQREQLIARARALVATSAAQNRDGLDKVRALQAEWQGAARSLPLARAVENALWSDFKTAIDALYDARHADIAARDAAFKAQIEVRTVLIARLEKAVQVTTEVAADTLERTLAEVDTQWRQAGAAPRAEAAALEARFRTARDAAQALVTSSKQRRWCAQCDTLIARLAERERSLSATRGGIAEPASFASPPEARPALPPEWERALAQTAPERHADAQSNDELLLKLEAALGIDSPPTFHAARRALKLQAMKVALEARPAGATAQLAADELLVEALARDAFDSTQRERLFAIIGAMREGMPLRGLK